MVLSGQAVSGEQLKEEMEEEKKDRGIASNGPTSSWNSTKRVSLPTGRRRRQHLPGEGAGQGEGELKREGAG